jgi:hypothetical protein
MQWRPVPGKALQLNARGVTRAAPLNWEIILMERGMRPEARLFFMSGKMAAGKSTYARQLAQPGRPALTLN